ncbi:cilia-and flagella-associated 44 [Solea senegalensis]|uniref:Cilia- and flagella-associated protein 44 n=1 Tax=Solea senegalensis TaxID=28829 RepID=A0AAV6R004_SOLSE|nr:cilia-and flagella-associated 44 [Solea senegalensis]
MYIKYVFSRRLLTVWNKNWKNKMAEEDTASVEKNISEAFDVKPSVMQQQQEVKQQLSADTYYKYEDLTSRPFVTLGSEIPENLLHLSHSFGYDSRRRENLQLLDDRTLMFIAGNLLVLLDVVTAEHKYLRSCSGGGIGAITVHPSREFFVAAEKGKQPNILVYEYPSLRLYRVLRGGTAQAFSSVQFNHDGSVLASVGGAPDYMLTLWNWRREEVVLRCKAISQEVYRVSFSPYNPGLLTSSGSGHIKFWKIASTFTGLKLQGHVGHFGITPATDIDGYVELPDGKVVSGTEWGNLLLWDGNAIKAEICRRDGRSCHTGAVQPFVLDDGQLMTIGSDGVVRAWDFESINVADESTDRRLHLVCSGFQRSNLETGSVVHQHGKFPTLTLTLYYTLDTKGSEGPSYNLTTKTWNYPFKLLCFHVFIVLSGSAQTPDPECLFSFHAGAIKGLDVSQKSHLMATTAPDRSVRIFDILSKTEVTTSRFNQGGTALIWAPPLVKESGGLLVTGFEDGVVRVLELYSAQRHHMLSGRNPRGDARLRLLQAFKPHTAAVTALAFDRQGDILASGSSDCTVFFFAVGETYSPIGFVHVPGPVQELQWSPRSHSESTLLVLCQSGHVVEVHSPHPKAQNPTKTFQLLDLLRRSFRFRSIKSRIKREEEITRRKAVKEEEKKEREKRLQETEREEEDEDEELPPIYIPDPPSPLYCGFYSQPGHFWLSMGGFDSGFLYHCKFPEEQDEDLDQVSHEPFDFLSVHDTDDDPVLSVTFSAERQLLLCGTHSGAVRVYPLQPDDPGLSSMRAHWALSVHDNQYGHLRHIRCSHDDCFVLTAGDDGNIFSFSLLPPEELQRSLQSTRAEVPPPRVGLENKVLAQDIEDPAADSIETAKQNLETSRLQREAELKLTAKRKKLAELQRTYKQLLTDNQRLSQHVRLTPEELQLDSCFQEQAELEKSRRILEVRKQLSWEDERSRVALSKIQEWFWDSLEDNAVSVVGVHSDHSVSTYLLQTLTELQTPPDHVTTSTQPDADGDAAAERSRRRGGGAADDSSHTAEEEALRPRAPRPAGIKLGDRQEEKLRKAAEKAEQARAKIEKRKQEWTQLYAEKPDEDYEDPQAARAIRDARENVGDLPLRTETERTVPEHLRTNTERKRAEINVLEKNIRDKQTEMNGRIVALRDTKVRLVSRLQAQAEQLHDVQQRLAVHLRRPPPVLPMVRPEETPERRLQFDSSTLERYRVLREQRLNFIQQEEEEEEEGTTRLLEQLEKERDVQDRGGGGGGGNLHPSLSSGKIEDEEEEEEEELNELEAELHREEEIKLLYEQDSLLEQMERSVRRFDAELLLLRHHKLHLDWQLKTSDLRHITLCQELLLLMEFERRESGLQGALDRLVREEKSIASRVDECDEQLRLKQRDVAKLQERHAAVVAAFHASLGQSGNFEASLVRIFRKNVRRVKTREHRGSHDEDEDSDEDSDEDDDDSGSEENTLQNCDSQLYENTLKLRERRVDVETLLQEEKRRADALKEERDVLVKKQRTVKVSVTAAENDLELIHREKQQKMNELDVVVPLRLHQIEFISDDSLPSDLSEVLVVDRTELDRLQRRIEQLHLEKNQQREARLQVRRDHGRLIHDCRDLKAEIRELEEQCDALMMRKFGRLLDLEALQTLTGNRDLEELKQQKVLQETQWTTEIKEWDVKVEASHDALMEVTKHNTELLARKKNLVDENTELKRKLDTRQKNSGAPFQDHRRRVDQEETRRLQALVKKQSEQAEVIRREIHFLSRKGGHVVALSQAPLPPLPPVSTTTTGHTHTSNHRPVRPFKLVQVHKSHK